MKSFQDDLFYHETDIIYPRQVNFSKDGNGKVYFRGNMYLNQGIFVVDGGAFDYFIVPNINFGIQSQGMIFEVDNLNLIWSIAKYRFYMYSFDITNYTIPLEAINYKSFRELDVNDVAAGINAGGDMHWDLSNAKYEVPKGSGKNSVFTSALWIGALDQAGQLHLSAQTYRQTGDDFWPGPIDEIAVPFDSASTIAFNRVWKIDKWKIEEFKTNFLLGNVTNGTYGVPEEMSSWPAKGNGIVSGNLAPFVDFNANGFYNPMDGDYPEIKGDQMIYRIFNDSLADHSNSSGLKLGIEIHASAYSFYCQGTADTNNVINRTTFYNYTIINRSQNNYDSLFVGLWCDMDLGNASDDYVGCDTTLATGFTYNGDNDDEMVYGLNPPIQNVKILKGILADPGDGIDNDLDGTIDEPSERTTMNHFMYYNNAAGGASTNPNGANDYWNYMQSIWLDGQHLTYGGDGRDPLNPPTNFFYSGTPYAATGWTEASPANIPEDRRFLMSSGPVTFNAGDTATIDFAYIFTWDSLNANGLTTSIAKNIQGLQLVQNWFDNNSFPSCINYTVNVLEINSNLNTISIFPNPAANRLFVNRNADDLSTLNFVIYDLLGAEVKAGKLFSDEINIEELAKQMYILKIGNEKGYDYLRFVKM
ncbi:MAG: T9SS type A sorting domain-containing protein [Bacteroidetes bacterium]|nr:T9SS type A sorting domain-containing protein [Bacteroidota bacterium]